MPRGERLPPHDLDAERAILGAMMLDVSAARDGFAVLVPADFYNPRHQLIFATMVANRADGETIDPVALNSKLRAADPEFEWLPMLLETQNACPAISMAPRYAEVVTRLSQLRQIIALAADMTEQAYAQADPDEVMDKAKARLSEASLRAQGDEPLKDLTTYQEFASRIHARDREMAIPGLLATDERLLIVGGEGQGKMVLIRQLAIAIGGGLHPFTQRPAPQLPTLTLDLENPHATISHQAELSMKGARRLLSESIDAWILSRPEGLNLRTTSAQVYLEKAMQFVQPKILCIGPIYKAARKKPNENWEDATLELLAVLDDIRTRFGCALIMEHHAPKGSGGIRDLVPFGASAWMRWPDYGIRLEPETTDRQGRALKLKIGTFRGARMDADWPEFLVRGGDFNLPWVGQNAPR